MRPSKHCVARINVALMLSGKVFRIVIVLSHEVMEPQNEVEFGRSQLVFGGAQKISLSFAGHGPLRAEICWRRNGATGSCHIKKGRSDESLRPTLQAYSPETDQRILKDDMTSLQALPTQDVSAVNVQTAPVKLPLAYASTTHPLGTRSDDIQSFGTEAGNTP
jgi:hypothetical protein